jgi:hypothetical protein
MGWSKYWKRSWAVLFTLFGVMLLSALSSAEPQKISHPQSQTPVTIADAAGRVHVRHQHIDYAQRKATARQRANALHKGAQKKQNREVQK